MVHTLSDPRLRRVGDAHDFPLCWTESFGPQRRARLQRPSDLAESSRPTDGADPLILRGAGDDDGPKKITSRSLPVAVQTANSPIRGKPSDGGAEEKNEADSHSEKGPHNPGRDAGGEKSMGKNQARQAEEAFPI